MKRLTMFLRASLVSSVAASVLLFSFSPSSAAPPPPMTGKTPPAVTGSFTPAEGKHGDIITIKGSGLDKVTEVRLGEFKLEIKRKTHDTIEAVVYGPAGHHRVNLVTSRGVTSLIGEFNIFFLPMGGKPDNFMAICTDKNKDVSVRVRMDDGLVSLFLMSNRVGVLTPKYVTVPAGGDQKNIIEFVAVGGRPMQINKSDKTLSFKEGSMHGVIPGEICKVNIVYASSRVD